MKSIYHNAIRDLVHLSSRKGKTGQCIRYEIGTDEVNDPTLVAYRVYGNRDDYDAVMVCAGTNSIFEPLPQREIILPTSMQLIALKRAYKSMTAIL